MRNLFLLLCLLLCGCGGGGFADHSGKGTSETVSDGRMKVMSNQEFSTGKRVIVIKDTQTNQEYVVITGGQTPVAICPMKP